MRGVKEHVILYSFSVLSICYKDKEKKSVEKDYYLFPLTQPSPFGEGLRAIIYDFYSITHPGLRITR